MSDECDRILAWSEDIKLKLLSNQFHEDDTRRAFIQMIYDGAYRYYLGIAFLELMRLSNKKLIGYREEIRYFEHHVNRLTETTNSKILEASQFNFLNRSLLMDSWSSFELCCTTLVGCLVTEKERDHILSWEFRNLKKLIPKTEFSEELQEKLKKKMTAKSLVHVPIIRKYDFLFKKCESYNGNEIADREFLKFVGKFRNTVHSNFIYHGTSYEYTLNGVHFKFENRKAVVWTDGTTKVYFDMLDRLLEIWDNLCSCIDYQGICTHPHE